MNQFFIKKYIEKLTKQDIQHFSQNQNINPTKQEIDILYYYIKNKSNYFLNGQHQEILNELKNKLTTNTYSKIQELYEKYKNKI